MDEALQRLAAAHGVAAAYDDVGGGRVEVGEDTVRAVLAALGVDCTDLHAAADAAEDAPWLRVLPPVAVVRQGVGGTVALHLPTGARVAARVEGPGGTRQVHAGPPGATRTVAGHDLERRPLALPPDLAIGDAQLVVEVAGAEHRAPLIVAPRAVRAPRHGWGWTTQLYQVRSARSWGAGDLADLAALAALLAEAPGHPAFLLTEPFHAPSPTSPVEPSPYFPATRRFTSPLLIAVDAVGRERGLLAAFAAGAGGGTTGFTRTDPPGATARHASLPADRPAPFPTPPPHDHLADPPAPSADIRGTLSTPSPTERPAPPSPGAGARPAPSAAPRAGWAGLAERARAACMEAIDRDAVWEAKREALERVFGEGPWEGFAAWRGEQGVALERWAVWCALAEQHGPAWRRWPAALRHPDRAGVAQAAAALADRVTFHAWLQWVVDGQRAQAQAAAVAAGLTEGLVADLAVGVSPDGADAWALQDDLALGVSVGAPPDPFNALGQDWRQPPLRPDRLEATAYAPFREIIRAAVRHAGGLRVDHIAGLFRQWWVPEGATPDLGTYVAMPAAALLDVLVAEAAAAGAFVVGEDLGVVPASVRPAMAERGILGNRVVWFERSADGRRLASREYPRHSLVMVTTHDLPTSAGWWSGAALQADLDLLPEGRTPEAHAAAAAQERRELAELLAREGAEPDGVDALVLETHALAARTPCRLVGVALADAVGDRRQPNLPGTIDEYPNWRLPLTGPAGDAVTLDQLAGHPGVAALANTVAEAREPRTP